MLNWINSLLTTKSAPPVWEAGARELVLVVNQKNKIQSLSGDSPGLLAVPRVGLKGKSIFSLINPNDQDALAAAINYIRRTAQNAHRKSTKTGEVARSVPPRELTVRLNTKEKSNVQHQERIAIARIQAADARCVRIYLYEDNDKLATSEDALTSRESIASKPIDYNSDTQEKDLICLGQLADLSHEMKTPLNAILGFADAMRQETFGPIGNDKYTDYINDIHLSGQHLMGLVTSVLDIARLDSDAATLKPILGDIGSVVDSCVSMVSPQFETGKLKLRVEIDRDLPEFYFDPQAIRQILLNLLTNAIKFTSDGEISVLVTRQTETDALQIIVSDTGIGMSTEQLTLIGERFSNLQVDGVRGTAGHGLGLTLAVALVDQCGGNLNFESAPGEGLRATIYLPMITDQALANAIIKANAISASTLHSTSSSSNPITSNKGDKPPLHEATMACDEAQAGKPQALETQMERIDDFRRKIIAERKSNAA